MITIRKPNYTVKILKDGTVKTTYKRTHADRKADILMFIGAALILSFWVYNLAQTMIHLAK